MNILGHIGLTDKQENVYMTLLEHGALTITELAKKSELKRPTVYLIIDELELLGLISITKKNRNRVVSAVHPRRVAQIAQLRAKTIEQELPSLVARYNAPKDKPKVHVYEGKKGVKDLYEEIYRSLNNREELLVFTRIDSLTKEELTRAKQMFLNTKNPKIRELNYGNEAGRKWYKEITTFAYRGTNHDIRLLPEEVPFGFTDNMMFENKLVVFSKTKDVFVIVIESEEIVKTFKALFEWAWKSGISVER